MEFLYEIGEDCWLIKRGYGKQIYRAFVTAQIIEKTKDGEFKKYRIRISDNQNEIECDEDNLFDVKTRCHEAICVLENIISSQLKN